jgi:hypothetical protein
MPAIAVSDGVKIVFYENELPSLVDIVEVEIAAGRSRARRSWPS